MLREESRQRMFELRVLIGLLKRRVCMKRKAANGCVIRSFIICVVIQILQHNEDKIICACDKRTKCLVTKDEIKCPGESRMCI